MYSGNHKISYGCKKFTRHPDFKILWRSTSFPCAEWRKGGGGGLCSSPTSHKATVSARRQYSSYPKISFCYFFNLKALHFMNNKITIMHRIIYYQNYAHLVAKSIFSRNSNKQFKPSNSINLCTNLQEKTLITIQYSP